MLFTKRGETREMGCSRPPAVTLLNKCNYTLAKFKRMRLAHSNSPFNNIGESDLRRFGNPESHKQRHALVVGCASSGAVRSRTASSDFITGVQAPRRLRSRSVAGRRLRLLRCHTDWHHHRAQRGKRDRAPPGQGALAEARAERGTAVSEIKAPVRYPSRDSPASCHAGSSAGTGGPCGAGRARSGAPAYAPATCAPCSAARRPSSGCTASRR